MTEKEKIMYDIMGIITASNLPIVFKGAMVTKLVLAESNYLELARQTKDIDANWVGEPPTMTELVETINRTLNHFNGRYTGVAYREYAEKRSAGISIMDNNIGENIFDMDINIKSVTGVRAYNYGETIIHGVLPNEILADKITVLSKNAIFRRTKDIVDIYALTHCVKVNTLEIFDVFRKNSNREVGDFSPFLTRRDEIKYAYDKLTGVDGKPNFDDIYAYLEKLIPPFAKEPEYPLVWNADKREWSVYTIKEQMNDLKEMQPQKAITKTKHEQEL